jgi:hypothetical protein
MKMVRYGGIVKKEGDENSLSQLPGSKHCGGVISYKSLT